jgi:pimeloyl-ACP methyl ester carboxylesterase
VREAARRRPRIAKVVLIGLATIVILFSVCSMVVVKTMYDRQFQRADKPRFSGYLTYGDVDGYDRRVVRFRSGGNTLVGYVYGEHNDKGLVVIAHGLGGGAESYLAETLYFVDNGWRVFSFDCTGSHESEGKGTIGLPQSVLDLNSALGYIESDNSLNDLPVMLYGHSWGGYAVAAVLNNDHDIAAAASIAGFNAPMEILFEQAKEMMGSIAYVEYPFLWAYQTMLFGRAARLTAVDGVNSADTAAMIIHGDKDGTVSYGGASIMAHKREITNPNVVYKTCTAENHNGHRNLFRSEVAVEYTNQKNRVYQELHDLYNGSIPDGVLADYYSNIDKTLASEVDTGFMDEINRFFERRLPN